MDVNNKKISVDESAKTNALNDRIYLETMTDKLKDNENNERSGFTQTGSQLLNLPTELLDFVLSFLPPRDLDAVVYSCRYLYIRASSDNLWQRLVQDCVPGYKLETFWPSSSYRSLYRAHDPHWFVPKHKIWFGDQHLFGRIMITYYNPHRGTFDGYRLVAERAPATTIPWDYDQDVFINTFTPRVRLHMDIPLLRLEALEQNGNSNPMKSDKVSRRFDSETPMPLSDQMDTIAQSTFMLTRPAEEFPSSSIWPPTTIPATQRVTNLSDEILGGYRNVGALVRMMAYNKTFTGAQKPRSRMEICEQAFRIRQWMRTIPGHRREPTQIDTYATLDPALYTPTATRPFRGIWVGDYGGHGCEFLLMNQPDNEVPFDESTIVQRSDESQGQFLARKQDAQIYRGRIEAIKLTGDPNIPRGEYTFISEDIGDNGLVRIADEDPFKGAKIVRSIGQLANRDFINAGYVESELILISSDRIAHYWKSLKHISFFERVKVDDFIIPDPKSTA